MKSLTTRSAVTLTLYVLLAILILSAMHRLSAERIAASEAAALATSLNSLLPEDYDNDPASDVIHVKHAALGIDDALPVYRARRANRPMAAVLTVVAPDGYSGNIHLLLGVRYDGSIIGVRVTGHRETPGLGDDIDHRRSSWINQFDDLSLDTTSQAAWRVKKDGGRFDQLTGATITPRAVVAAVYRALGWYRSAREQVFSEASSAQ